jgi:hypothetical protein
LVPKQFRTLAIDLFPGGFGVAMFEPGHEPGAFSDPAPTVSKALYMTPRNSGPSRQRPAALSGANLLNEKSMLLAMRPISAIYSIRGKGLRGFQLGNVGKDQNVFL